MHIQQPARGKSASPGTDHPAARPDGPAKRTQRPESPPGGNLDLLKLAWNGRWLLLLGLIVGLAAGYLQFVQSPPIFRSTAKIQIIESSASNLPGKELQDGPPNRSLRDEALVMRSERILKKAVELGALSMTPEFSGMDSGQIATILSTSDRLVIGPAEESSNTSVFKVQYDTTSATTSRRVVQSVVDAYSMHLQEHYRSVGEETIELIETARSDISEKLTKLENEYEEFKRDSELMYRDGRITSVHRDNAEHYLTQKQSLSIREAQLSSTLNAAKEARDEGRSPKTILLAIHESPLQQQQLTPELGQMRPSERMRNEQLLPLQIERDDMAAELGSNHPAMQSLDRRIRIMEKTIAAMDASEQEFQQLMEETWEEGDADPDATLRQMVDLKIAALSQQLEAVHQEMKLVSEGYEREIDAAKAESAAEMRSTQYAREIGRQQELYDRIVARLDEVNLMSEGSNLKVFPLDVAEHGYQIAPSMMKSLFMGGFLGCMIAGGFAFLREFADRSYHSAREIAEHTGLPVIGHIPVLRRQRLRGAHADTPLDSRLYTVFNSKSARAEAFRAVRTALYFSNQGGDHQVLQITSPTPGDGKSTIAANLAVSIAQSGRHVLLIDADFRRPRIHRLFGLNAERGFAWAIEQISRVDRRAGRVLDLPVIETDVPNLSVMAAGQRPDNPSELLSSAAFDEVIDSLRDRFDTIILDTPPLLAVSDPSNVAARADAVLMVVRLMKNIKPRVAHAARMLETLEANVLGIVVSGVGSRQARGYGKESEADGYYNSGLAYKHGYGYSYGSTSNGYYTEYYQDEPAAPPVRHDAAEQPEEGEPAEQPQQETKGEAAVT